MESGSDIGKRKEYNLRLIERRTHCRRCRSHASGEGRLITRPKMARKIDRTLKSYYKTLLETNNNQFMSDLSSFIKSNKDDKVFVLLSILRKRQDHKSTIKKYREGEDNTETLLHIAIKYEDNKDIVEKIIQLCPDLLSMARESLDYGGQTPLHIAITKSRDELVELLLTTPIEKEDSDRIRNRMLNTSATGRIFTNTVMMGQLPLSVAALTFNENVVDLLLSKGSEIHAQNICGDTVLHSLVKYAAVYPDKTKGVIDMLDYFNIKLEEAHSGKTNLKETRIEFHEGSCVWFLKNKENLTPLQLSAKLGVVEVFQFIIKLNDVYSFVNTDDGLFDVKLYDITEIDTVANLKATRTPPENEGNFQRKFSRNNFDGVSLANTKSTVDCSPFGAFEYPKTESILEMMFANEYQNSSAFRIIESSPVKNIILEKWKKIKFVYFVWGVIHLFMTIFLTVEVVIRSSLYSVRSATNATTLGISVSAEAEAFADVVLYGSFIVGGCIYTVLTLLLLIAKFRRPNCSRYLLHNSGYLLFLLTFSICLWVDFFMTRVLTYHDNIALVIAIIMGWSFMVFFLRAFYLFGFFTEMIRRVIFGDLLRFAVIILFMLFAFTAGIYAAFIGELGAIRNFDQYNEAVSGSFDSYGSAMLMMFKLMLGLDDIGVLYEARLPWLSVTLYIIFALLTYVLLMNSLIAMMSQTFAQVHENRYPQWRLQQLSVILFIEDLFCLPCIRNIFGSPGEEQKTRAFDPGTKQSKDSHRYYFKIHSLEQTYASEEDKEAIKHSKSEEVTRLGETYLDTSGMMSATEWDPAICRYSLRRRPTTRMTYLTPDFDGGNTDMMRRISPRRNKRLSRVIEEEKLGKQHVRKMGSEPDLIKHEKSPDFSRKRYNSENMHENRRSPRSLASGSSDTHLNRSGPLTPVDVKKINVHEHSHLCPERKDYYFPNGNPQVDIEPYPHSSA